MPSSLNFNPLRVLDASGDPVPGALATFFETGTTTPLTVYTDGGLGTAHPSPLEADGQGVFPPVFTSGATAVKVIVTTATGGSVNGYPIDPVQLISSTGSAASSVSFSPITGNAGTNVQEAVEILTEANNTALDLGGTSPYASAAQGDTADAALPLASVLDEDDFATDSATLPPSQQSAKAYIDFLSGVGRVWQDVTGSRVSGVDYQNTTGRDIMVSILSDSTTVRALNIGVTTGSYVNVADLFNSGSDKRAAQVIVPADHFYQVDAGPIDRWIELR